MTAHSARQFGLVDEVLEEPLGGAHRDPAAAAATLKTAILCHLAALGTLSPEELLEARYTKFRQMGRWEEDLLVLE